MGCQLVFHARWNFAVIDAFKEAIFHQLLELLGEGGFGDVANATPKLSEMPHIFERNVEEYLDLPFPACKFCTLYDELPFKFKASELSTIESDLLEAQTWFHDPLSKIESHLFSLPAPKHCRVFLAGANPFALKAKRLLEIAGFIHEHFPTCKTIGCFARVTDIASKTDEELVALREAGYTGLTIGIETGEDKLRCYRTNLKHL